MMEGFPARATVARAEDDGSRTASIDETLLLVAFAEPTPVDEAREFAAEFDLELERDRVEDDRTGENRALPSQQRVLINDSDARYWMRADEPVSEETFTGIEERDDVEWVTPAYVQDGVDGLEAYFAPIPDRLVVRYRETPETGIEGETLAATLADEFHLEEDAGVEHLGSFRVLKVETERGRFLRADGERMTAVRVLDRLNRERPAGLTDVTTENHPLVSPLAVVAEPPGAAARPGESTERPPGEEAEVAHVPDDSFFAEQWNMATIEAPSAWNLSVGSRTVKVGVLDTGCDLSHPDLRFDGPGYNAGTGARDGSPVGRWYEHGTAVAGLAAAVIDNSQGVAGVGGGCLIHAVSLPNITEVEVARGIREAADAAGVDAINMSFGWGSPPVSRAIIDEAIEHAHDRRGVVLSASAGNSNRDGVGYPASHPKVIAVAASDQVDKRKTPGSPDGEHWWGSNYGDDVDVAAPGVRCWTTDVQGERGYNDRDVNHGSPDGNYFKSFNGTSAASPHVAGLAALVKSFNPSLRNVEIRQNIERSCSKVGGYTYQYTSGRRNGTWNRELGYGRIDASRALRLSGYTQRRYTGTLFGGTLEPNETQYRWTGPWAHHLVVDYGITPTTHGGWLDGEVDSTYRVNNGVYYRLAIQNRRSTPTNFRVQYSVDYDYP
jgi:subtilisin family serine protease